MGVVAARVRPAADGSVEEVEVLAEGGKAPAQVVADVKSFLFARFGLSVDPERIRVARVQEARAMGIPGFRAQVARIGVHRRSGDVEVEVGLRRGPDLHVGRAAAPRVRAFLPRLAAAAALQAAQAAAGAGEVWEVKDITRLELAGIPALVVAVRCGGEGRKGLLLGTSVIDGDELEAATRAVLDAVNRRLATKLSQSSR